MRNKIRDSLKAENGSVHGESKQGRSGMANDLDPHNKANQMQKVQAGSTVAKELRSASSGFSLKPESRLSAAAVEAKKHNPKAVGTEEECVDQGQGDEKEGDASYKQLTDSHSYPKDEFQDQLSAIMLEAMAKTFPLATSHPSYSDFFQNLHDGDEFATDVVTMGGPVERPVEIHTSALVLDFSLTHAPFSVSLQDAMAIIIKRSHDQTLSAPA
jgi:hypothetical protein